LLGWITVMSVVVVSLFHWMITPFISPKDRVFQLMRLWVWSLHCTLWCSWWVGCQILPFVCKISSNVIYDLLCILWNSTCRCQCLAQTQLNST
jgi:hypothetical protein